MFAPDYATAMHDTFDWITRWADYQPDHLALGEWESGRSLSYGDLNRLANRLAHHLTRDLGLVRGDRVAILAENCLEYVIFFAATQKTGIILVPLNYRLSTGELAYVLSDARPELLVVEEKFAASLPGDLHVTHLYRLEQLPVSTSKDSHTPDDVAFAAAEDLHEDDPVFILYTSGTTGFPKGALYTHRMLFWNSINTALRLHLTGDDRTLNVMPPFHTGGWNVLLTPLLHHGGYTCLMKKFDAAAVLRALDAERCTIFMGVPTMLKMMAEDAAFGAAQLREMRYFLAGGEAMPIPLIETWATKGIPIRQGYGMTEVGPNLTSLHQDDAIRKKGSIGKPNFYVRTRIVDEQGRNLPPGEAGELWISGPMVTPGYWQQPGATAQAMADGWFRTGDRVLRDEEGYLYVVDRIKNMFISGGENVYPAEIERVLATHPAVLEVCVVAMPHPRWGEVGKAWVVLRTGQDASPDALKEYCAGRLARFKIPHVIACCAALPKNATGKIDRRALQQA
ncbi:MAG: long-chain fatty acid--CoA ligase [Bacteroidia bacterium]